MTQRYDQVNIVTFIGMIFIFTIHYFNKYTSYISSTNLLVFTSFLRGVALIAVPLYIVNTGYSYIYLNKKVNFKNIFFYIIIPTLILTQINLKLTGNATVFWDVKEGFSNSWFVDMYLPLMILVPLIQYYYNINFYSKISVFILSAIGLCAAYLYSIQYSATLLNLGILVFIPYIPLLIFLSFTIFDTKFNNQWTLSVLFLLSTLLISFGYFHNTDPSVPKLVFFNSYFGPLATIATICLYKLIYNSNLKIPYLRIVSRSSYFFYFLHHSVLKIYSLYLPNRVPRHIIFYYLFGIVISVTLSTILYTLYDKLLVGLKINDKGPSIRKLNSKTKVAVEKSSTHKRFLIANYSFA